MIVGNVVVALGDVNVILYFSIITLVYNMHYLSSLMTMHPSIIFSK